MGLKMIPLFEQYHKPRIEVARCSCYNKVAQENHWLFSSTANTGFHPNGVGGLDGRNPVVSIQIAEYTFVRTKDHFDNLSKEIAKLTDD